ncbi:MAG: hypothetical protein LBI04_09060 [Treponema sp.]|jgi:hypothetical protein|nr:hypothetical protein [Treponema sp.]
MIRKGVFSLFLLFSAGLFLFAQGYEAGNVPYVIRGEVYVDLEPIYAGHVDGEYPLSIPVAAGRALEEAAMFFSAMIYGWSFHYDIGERARQIEENLELSPAGVIHNGDPRLNVTDVEVRDSRLRVWTDYQLTDLQQSRVQSWRNGIIRNAQGVGYSPASIAEYPGWLELKKAALEDAARSALRAMLRGSERNRPKEVTGFISLVSFPRFYIDSGRWTASARFRVQIAEIIPFAAY